MYTLSIIIISFNTKEFIKNCLSSIFENTSKDFEYEIIIVDNGSTDGTVYELSSIKMRHPNVKIIEKHENLGFSKACNIGVKASNGKYLLFLNSDTLVYKNTLEEMVAFMDYHSEAGAATCYVALPNGKLDDASHRGFPTPWRALGYFSGLASLFPHSEMLNGYHLAYKELDNVHEIEALAGAFIIVRKEAGEQIKWWDEDYFFYGEDIDFCYRLKEKGWKIFFVPSVKILHYKGVSSGIKNISKKITTADRDSKKKIQHARFEAMKIFYRKHYEKKYPKFLTSLVFLGINIKRNIIQKKLEIF